MDLEEAKKLVKRKSSSDNKTAGGQTVGRISSGVVLEFDSYIKIEINSFRSQMKNIELASTLMDLALTEIIND